MHTHIHGQKTVCKSHIEISDVKSFPFATITNEDAKNHSHLNFKCDYKILHDLIVNHASNSNVNIHFTAILSHNNSLKCTCSSLAFLSFYHSVSYSLFLMLVYVYLLNTKCMNKCNEYNQTNKQYKCKYVVILF